MYKSAESLYYIYIYTPGTCLVHGLCLLILLTLLGSLLCICLTHTFFIHPVYCEFFIVTVSFLYDSVDHFDEIEGGGTILYLVPIC